MHSQPSQTHTHKQLGILREPVAGTGADADPLCHSCVTSPGRGDSHAAPCLIKLALQKPISLCQTHFVCVCALLCTALGLWAHYRRVGTMCDLHAWQLCTQQGSFVSQLSLSSESPHRPHPLMAMPLLPANASRSPLHWGQANVGCGGGKTIV